MYIEDYSKMTEEANRLASFTNWPVVFLTPQQMAKNGFYYIGVHDEVRCAFCKVEFRKWMEGDNPADHHRKWAPQCPFLNNKIDAGQDVCGTREVIFAPSPAHPQYATKTARLRTFERNWPCALKQKPEQLADAGFFYTGQGDKTICFFCNGGLKDWEDGDEPWEQHARWFDNCIYVQLVKGRDYVQNVISNACVIPAAKKQMPKSDATLVSHAVVEVENKRELEDSKACRICFEEERNVCFVPCGHVATCGKCAVALQNCPTCRVKINNAVRMYQV
ncbi:IAP-3 [Buzura suppressaria nucleopolyhedrovirus]|uniref:IAP-3 n=1 Tax=Buzura suppressaria nuclear polyhedrosis virus TaxID=74320 RepID=W5VSC3_NPVBS|nr:IAP-3 [Buzura suppressaria nucleopolyhedrovirus]AHH82682.1 IAP-3 [Buzura suppressaria nucleopolyhedrovirus]AKN91066.1 IAP-3 [Buzura suppressaria nucleopolyhedrovirus]QYF10571.1 inhibitor of apoptosis protein 3 [Buzura suppressaria nucleopolyhedrovirus]